MDSDRPIGIKLCIDPKVEPPKKGDIIDLRYNLSIGKTDTKSSVSWKYLSLYMDRESRKAVMSKQCDAGDGNICVQLGQMHWQDKEEDLEIESYRKACEIAKGYCTYYVNALRRTGREDEVKRSCRHPGESRDPVVLMPIWFEALDPGFRRDDVVENAGATRQGRFST